MGRASPYRQTCINHPPPRLQALYKPTLLFLSSRISWRKWRLPHQLPWKKGGKSLLVLQGPLPLPGHWFVPPPPQPRSKLGLWCHQAAMISTDTSSFKQMGSTKECQQPSDGQLQTKIKANPQSREISGWIRFSRPLFFYPPNREAAARR